MGRRDITATDLPMGALEDLWQATLELSIPLYWQDTTLPWPKPLKGGSSFVLKFDDRLILITAAHVYRVYQEDAATNPNLICALRTLPIDLPARLIDADDDLDIATFWLSEQDLALIGGCVFNVQQWPPPEPVEGRGLALAGFPLSTRKSSADRTAVFEAYGTMPCIDTFSAR